MVNVLLVMHPFLGIVFLIPHCRFILQVVERMIDQLNLPMFANRRVRDVRGVTFNVELAFKESHCAQPPAPLQKSRGDAQFSAAQLFQLAESSRAQKFRLGEPSTFESQATSYSQARSFDTDLTQLIEEEVKLDTDSAPFVF
jgi:hypothetical protein